MPNVVSSLRVLFCQHLPSRPGSHQQLSSLAFLSQLAVLRHLLICSAANSGRCAMLMMALMVPGLFTWSCGIAEVSVTPGRGCANSCHSRLEVDMPEPSNSDICVY